MRIAKFTLQRGLSTQLALPEGSKALRVTTTQTEAILWILIPDELIPAVGRLPENPLEAEYNHFRVFMENQDISEGAEYIDSFSLDNGYTHRHLFKVK